MIDQFLHIKKQQKIQLMRALLGKLSYRQYYGTMYNTGHLLSTFHLSTFILDTLFCIVALDTLYLLFSCNCSLYLL